MLRVYLETGLLPCGILSAKNSISFISHAYHQWHKYSCSLKSFGGIMSILEMLINTVVHRRFGKPSKAPEVQPDDAVLIAIGKLRKYMSYPRE
uniref:Uncharacterized protein n=1 Tax=Amphimedon queenslandica TaxID=400682 RepID=A0A1X7T7A7_AMPQE